MKKLERALRALVSGIQLSFESRCLKGFLIKSWNGLCDLYLLFNTDDEIDYTFHCVALSSTLKTHYNIGLL